MTLKEKILDFDNKKATKEFGVGACLEAMYLEPYYAINDVFDKSEISKMSDQEIADLNLLAQKMADIFM